MLDELHHKTAKRTAMAAVAFAVLLLTSVLLLARSVYADPELVRSQPPNDAVLDEAPARVEMWFDQPLAADFAATEVTLERAGASTEIRPLYAAVDHRDPTRLLVSPPQSLDEGDYVVMWRITSAEDGSVSEGEYAFSIDSSAPASSGSEGDSGPDILFIALMTTAGIGGGAVLGLLLYLARRALGLGGHPTTETSLPEHH
ncbi:MAG TPA: copper resistance CopC family protein [Dehalococcoidia bacterium]|nr:copper resistance CopC family protein [Dehalococcoidia bacterium]